MEKLSAIQATGLAAIRIDQCAVIEFKAAIHLFKAGAQSDPFWETLAREALNAAYTQAVAAFRSNGDNAVKISHENPSPSLR